MQKIIPHLWFDKEAVEAANFYTSLFASWTGQGESKITHTSSLKNTPSGDTDIVSFHLLGQSFMAISAGPYFKPNPSISFMVNFDPSRDKDAATRIDDIWEKLSEGGKVLMELGTYPFSEKYGWIQDKYGFSWQLILTKPEGEERPALIPSLLFTKEVSGKAEEATDFYLSVFKNSKRGTLAKYPEGSRPGMEGQIMFTDFMLANQWFVAMDGGSEHEFTFGEAISLLIECEDQAEIDYFWEKLSAVPEAEQCGWLKDKYGVSWQVSPKEMNSMMEKGSPEQIDRVTQAFLKMKKFDLEKLREAFEGK